MSSVSQSGATIRDPRPHVVIVGGGFGGLYAAKTLGNHPVRVTLIDKRNFHLFQPLLYQVATGSLSPGDIASPLRSVVRHYRNIEVVMDEVIDLDPQAKTLKLQQETELLSYDALILATGSETHYFGNDRWAESAKGLKSVEDALEIRRRIFSAFEFAEQATDPQQQERLLTFVIVGGGPTGVELAGTLAELSRFSLPKEFRRIDCRQARVLLVDMGSRLLSTYPEELSQKAAETLTKLGVSIHLETSVTDILDGNILLTCHEVCEPVQAGTILWAAGVKASPMGKLLEEKLGCALDRGGRVLVEPDCSVPGHPEIFVIGDLAQYTHTSNGNALPGVAPVAMQQGHYVAKVLLKRQSGQSVEPFQYQDQGSLAVIGIKEAVADLHRLRLSGFLAWLIWAFVHIRYLIGFDNRLLVMIQWAWALLTRRHSARLITWQRCYAE